MAPSPSVSGLVPNGCSPPLKGVCQADHPFAPHLRNVTLEVSATLAPSCPSTPRAPESLSRLSEAASPVPAPNPPSVMPINPAAPCPFPPDQASHNRQIKQQHPLKPSAPTHSDKLPDSFCIRRLFPHSHYSCLGALFKPKHYPPCTIAASGIQQLLHSLSESRETSP